MRISTQAANQSALLDLMRAQRDSFEARQQVTTGKVAPDLKGYGHASETIAAARSAQTRADSFVKANERLLSRLDIQDLAFRELSDAADQLRVALTTDDASMLMNEVKDVFERVKNALNTRFQGSFLFAGTRTDVPPVNADSVADLQAAAPDVGAVFENSDRAQTQFIDEGVKAEIGFLAQDVGEELFAVMERVADFDAGPDGPFDGRVTSAQQAFLRTEIQNVISAFDTINQKMGENGSLYRRVETAVDTHQKRADFLTTMISDIEDVDMAEAATRLSQAQTAVDVSARTFASLTQVSLLPFLR